MWNNRIEFLLVSFFCICSLAFTGCQTKKRSDRYVVVLSMDGFRSDYPSRAHTPTLDSLANVGVRSTFRPCYPSVTFPNHYSMATGLHPDHHGLVNNFFYDAELDSSYRMGNLDRDFMVENLFGIRRNAKGFVPLPSIGSVARCLWRVASLQYGSRLINRFLFQIVLIP